jgi:hypothetical protein
LNSAADPLNQAALSDASFPSGICGKGDSVSQAYHAKAHNRRQDTVEESDDIIPHGVGWIYARTKKEHGGPHLACTSQGNSDSHTNDDQW